MTTWIATTQDDKLADRTSDIESTNATTAADLQLDGNEYQALRGFGGCFNELGWLPLQNVSEAERDQIIKSCSARRDELHLQPRPRRRQ